VVYNSTKYVNKIKKCNNNWRQWTELQFIDVEADAVCANKGVDGV